MVANGAYCQIKAGSKVVFRSGSPFAAERQDPVQPSISLRAGQSVPFEVRFATNGPSWMQLNYNGPAGSGLVPPSTLDPAL
jgi:hypothetical protein